jgi:hypothetical protein
MLLPERGQLVEYWLSGPDALSCADMGGQLCMQDTQRQRTGAPWGEFSGLLLSRVLCVCVGGGRGACVHAGHAATAYMGALG